jgi:heterodisulfide reductase subunit B
MTAEKELSYTYYPGCSLEGLSKEYDISMKVVCEKLGMELEELDDWNCCGASTLVSVDKLFAALAPARVLALASEHDRDVVVGCNACYLVLRKTLEDYRGDETLRNKVDEGLAEIDRELNPEIRVRHLLDVVVEDLGTEAIENMVTNPLGNMRFAPYYGCQIARPYGPNNPTHMEDLIEALDGNAVEFYSKTRCCGSSLLASLKLEGLELARSILADAAEQDVDGIIAMCPLCQINLDAYQAQVNKRFNTSFDLPVLYFTQLLGLAIGIDSSELGFNRLITSPAELLEKFRNAQEVTVT